MKQFVFKVVLLFFFLVVVDVAVGFAFLFMENGAEGGYTFRDNYICNRLETDILISGSSRCVRHYNPQIFTDSFGLSCYNSGQMGNGIILNYGRLKMICERKKPLIFIYDLYPSFDLLVNEDNHKYLTWLKSHYRRDGIEEIFNRVDRTEKYKMLSHMYRYNSRLIELLADYFHPVSETRDNGFSPLIGGFDFNKIRKDVDHQTKIAYNFDSLKIEYIERMIDELSGSKLYFVVSPIWYGMDTLQFAPVKDICIKHGITFIDFSNDPKYVHNNLYFKDGIHLNAIGADEFTNDLIRNLYSSDDIDL